MAVGGIRKYPYVPDSKSWLSGEVARERGGEWPPPPLIFDMFSVSYLWYRWRSDLSDIVLKIELI